MKSSQPIKRNDKCDEINSHTTEDEIIFEHKEEIDALDNEIKVIDLESIETNDEINCDKTEDKIIFEHKEEIDTLDNENKVNNLESIETNLNLDILEKWMVKIFPPLNLNFLKLSNYSEDENISNEAIYARLIIILIFITLVLCFITFGQIIWISALSRGPIVVQPFIPKINNPFCK